jgi:hypothetical protein
MLKRGGGETCLLADSLMVDMVGRGGRSEPRRPASCSMTGERLALPPLPRRRSAYEAEGSRRRSSPSLSVPYIHAHTHTT